MQIVQDIQRGREIFTASEARFRCRCFNWEWQKGAAVATAPESMEAVEEHCEDRPRDIRCYRDADGNVYDFAFGLNWSGVINDERVKRYK